MHNLGHTRSANRRDHLLQTPDTFVRIALPCVQGGMAIVHMAPAGGAQFSQYTALFEAGGTLLPTSAQRFVYVLEGGLDLSTDASFLSLAQGGYAYLPPSAPHTLTAHAATRLAVIEKVYHPLPEVPVPALVTGHESDMAGTPLMGDAGLIVREMLPTSLGFDFAVNTMTYQPGAALSMVEIHVMEHGCLMLEGGGIYRLGDAWYPVTAGDFIWMAPFCPQWFGALGKQPAKYLIYKNWNRDPLV
jgi:(S)-ureidoglycine aminohydrolase